MYGSTLLKYKRKKKCYEYLQIFNTVDESIGKQEPVKPGDCPRIGFGHRKVVCPKSIKAK